MNSVILGFLSLFTAIHENPTPVIGVFTIPSDYAQYPEDQYSYFAASYVKFLESGGARVVPIPYEADESVLEKIF